MILENKMQDVKQIWCWKMNKENKKMQGHKVNMMHKKSAIKKNKYVKIPKSGSNAQSTSVGLKNKGLETADHDQVYP